MTIGEKIAQCRAEAGLSQRALAKKSGLTAPAISQYESGKRVPNLKCFISICKSFQVIIDDFIHDVAI